MASLQAIGGARALTRLRLSRATGKAASALWRRLDPANLNSWASSAARLLQIVTAAQLLQARESEEYVAEALAVQGALPPAAGLLNPAALAGIASDGRDLLSLLQIPVITAKTAIRDGASTPRAMAIGGAHLQTIVRTQVSDAGRVADSVSTIAREDSRWVRVLYGNSCSRCVVLAGRIYPSRADFERHPRCDCYSVPVSTARNAEDAGLITNPRAYFDSLSEADQNRVFTKAGAEAIRHGADISQVVNARRGAAGLAPAGGRLTAEEKKAIGSGRLQTTNVFGQQIYITTEGTTRRGYYGQLAAQRGTRMKAESAETVTRQSRNGAVQRMVQRQRAQVPRLMPESIFQLAKDRDDAIRLLKLYGYLF